MIYAIRQRGQRQTLVEMSATDLNWVPWDPYVTYSSVNTAVAHRWVRDGKEHETGLFVDDDGKLRYAPRGS